MVLSTICENRTSLSGAPSTCLVDTLIVPLPSFLFLIVLSILLALPKIHPAFPSLTSRLPGSGTSLFPKWLYLLHTVLVAAAVIMTVLEFVRLVIDQQGLGLLPVDTVALICITVLMSWRGRERNVMMSCLLDVYWLFIFAVEALKVARLNLLNTEHPSTDKRYPTSDWLLDNAVILALYAIFFVLESVYLFLALRQRKRLDTWQRDLKRNTVPYKHSFTPSENVEELGTYAVEETQTPLMGNMMPGASRARGTFRGANLDLSQETRYI